MQAELHEGETVLWAAKPIVRRLLRAALFTPRSWKSGWILWVFLAFIALTMIQTLPLLFELSGDRAAAWLAALPLAVALAILAVVVAYRVSRLARAYGSLFYVITDLRLLTAQSWPRTIVMSEPLETLLREPSAKYVNGDGSGSIIFSGTKGISGVPDIQGVSAILERLKTQ